MGIFDFLFNRKKEQEFSYDKSEKPSDTSVYDNTPTQCSDEDLWIFKMKPSNTNNTSEKDSVGQSDKANIDKNKLPSLDNIPENIANEAKGLVRQGYKLDAVKLIVNNTSAGLKEAKEFVDNIAL